MNDRIHESEKEQDIEQMRRQLGKLWRAQQFRDAHRLFFQHFEVSPRSALLFPAPTHNWDAAYATRVAKDSFNDVVCNEIASGSKDLRHKPVKFLQTVASAQALLRGRIGTRSPTL